MKTNKAFRENKKLMQEQASKNLAPKYAVNYRLLTYESKAFKSDGRIIEWIEPKKEE
jgi:hypothetical protein